MRLTIRDLEQNSGLARRTIHYYTHQGLLPSPAGLGPRAAYGEEHLLRLQLIRVLKTCGLRLDRVASTLDQLTLEKMRLLVAQAEEFELQDPRALAAWLGMAVRTTDSNDSPPPSEATASVPCERRWVRHQVNEGLEIHYCPDAGDDFLRRIAELRHTARRLFHGRD